MDARDRKRRAIEQIQAKRQKVQRIERQLEREELTENIKRAKERVKVGRYGCMAVAPHQSLIENGRSACTSIAFMAAFNFLREDHLLEVIRWDKVLDHGARLWSLWYGDGSNRASCYQHINDVLGCKVLDPMRDSMKMVLEYSGEIHQTEPHPRGATVPLSVAVGSIEPGQAAVLVAYDVSMALLRSPDGIYWVFDSHGGKLYNRKSALICFGLDLDERLMVFLRNHYFPAKAALGRPIQYSLHIFTGSF